eukprot:CAMPEP_0116146584 /NCGR_PEP_ID=MMETSP0329-20121206/17247_1 /TAXON_ID=697910 /ORGANISM="Pseudo-nitzschia arenysensis, Strain B593" /LENGTH=253 /DNA_ID=CAMNT_0003642351 /DNA_START=223 /DNA_END=984 /DNA_ORIENTATION=+
MVCLLVVAVCSTTCLSFTVPRQRTVLSPSGLFSQATTTPTLNESTAEESVSGNCEMLPVVDDDFDENVTPPSKNSAFKNAAESPAPPTLNESTAEESKKRVPVTIRYSAESGLKPYYLTVAKRVKDQYPDVLIERVVLSEEGTETADGESNGIGTFEVLVDGKIVVRTNNNQRAGTHTGSIFVSMAEMDLAITRARKRRRPTSVYGEDGKLIRNISGEIQDETVKSRLEVLKQKAMELQRENSMGNQSSDGKE